MVEHVGEERIDLYMRTLHGLLHPGGRLLNHGIAKLMDFDTKDEGAFSERFVFPDGVPLPLSRGSRRRWSAPAWWCVTSRGCPRTTRGRSPTGSRATRRATTRPCALAGEERARVWKLYLRAARAGFTTGWASVYQVLAVQAPRVMRWRRAPAPQRREIKIQP